MVGKIFLKAVRHAKKFPDIDLNFFVIIINRNRSVKRLLDRIQNSQSLFNFLDIEIRFFTVPDKRRKARSVSRLRLFKQIGVAFLQVFNRAVKNVRDRLVCGFPRILDGKERRRFFKERSVMLQSGLLFRSQDRIPHMRFIPVDTCDQPVVRAIARRIQIEGRDNGKESLESVQRTDRKGELSLPEINFQIFRFVGEHIILALADIVQKVNGGIDRRKRLARDDFLDAVGDEFIAQILCTHSRRKSRFRVIFPDIEKRRFFRFVTVRKGVVDDADILVVYDVRDLRRGKSQLGIATVRVAV